ncbi:MAG: hypothetical protein CBD69_009825 [Crocinitomicaceae bacterium TMED209]|nr:MAG: hypothetical protein CBD69_009825 [Crocinitomicaceae bacterium TMED209]
MKAEEFDQYVRAQFENETVAPRAEVEDGVFASLSAATRKRRGIAAVAILLVATSATALWLHAPAPAPTEVAVPVAVAPAIPADQPAEAAASVASTPSDEPERTAPESREKPAMDERATTPPVALDEVASRRLSGVELQETSEPQLQKLEGEKWVLPATVEVKD